MLVGEGLGFSVKGLQSVGAPLFRIARIRVQGQGLGLGCGVQVLMPTPTKENGRMGACRQICVALTRSGSAAHASVPCGF